MRILILGGTGAMGVPVVNMLNESENQIYVTTRSFKESYENVKFITGNARESGFLNELLKSNYDVIIDFMVYKTNEFSDRVEKLLSSCGQYFFFSSSRVYADSNGLITEKSARLLDVINDPEYLETDEYALSKAREENILFNSSHKNWTIIRPYITYNNYRLQLGVYEKENWLYRALNGKTIVFPKDIATKTTALTYGPDIASALVRLIGNKKALGSIYHIVNNEEYTWQQILDIYIQCIKKNTGVDIKYMLIDDTKELEEVWGPWQIRYDRLYNRKFDSSLILRDCGDIKFTSVETGINKCLTEFLNNPKWLNIRIPYEAWSDKIAKENTSIFQIDGLKNKYKYIIKRYL